MNMKTKKILKFILLLILVVLLLFFWKIIVNLVISVNLEVSKGNLLVLTFIYWVELFFLLTIYDLLMIELSVFLGWCLATLGRSAVRKKKIGITLFTIRLDYYLLRLTRLLRLGWVTYGTNRKSSVWVGLSKLPLSQMVLNIFRLIMSIPMLFALLSACISLKILRVDLTYYLSKLQEFFKGIVQTKININDIILRMPALVALLTLVPIIFFFYFYSQKREVRKIIDKENRQYFEEVVLLFERLLIWIDNNIYEISEHFDYVIDCQDLIVEVFLKKEIPNYISLTGKQYYSWRGIEDFRFIELSDLAELQEIITKLLSDRLVKFTRIFSVKRFDIWHLYFGNFHLLNEVEKIEKSFYTQNGMVSKLDKRHTRSYDFTQEQIEKERKKEYYLFSWSIYDDLKLLYELKRASDSLRVYLYSSRAEQLILKALSKSK